MNIDESKVPTAAKGSIEAGYGPKHRGDSLAAADLGVKLSPEQDEIVPPLVAIGPAGFETDAAGKPVELKRPTFYTKFDGTTWADEYAEMSANEQRCFRAGFIAARGELVQVGERTRTAADLFDKLTTLFEWLVATEK